MKAIFCVLMGIYFAYLAVNLKKCSTTTKGLWLVVSFLNIMLGLLFFIFGK